MQGRQSGYRELFYRDRGPRTLADELVLDVHAVGALSGTVRDGQARAVSSVRISAFRQHDGRPFGDPVGETGTDQSGVYSLLAPPDVPLFVVATPMLPQPMRWRSPNGVNDCGLLAPGLLPAARDVQLNVGQPRKDFDFTLADAATVVGTVRYPDGAAAVEARVHMSAAQAATAGAANLELSEHATLTVLPDRRLAISGDTTTNGDGQFALPAVPGQTVLLQPLSLPFAYILGNLPLKTATPPADVQIELPYPTTLRAIHQNELQPYTRLVAPRQAEMRFEKDGTRRVLVAEPTAVRADRGGLRSPWVTLPVANDEATIDLEMTQSLIEVAIEIEAEHRVRNASFTWKREDGLTHTETRQRDDRSGPFSLYLEPGTYQLRIGHASGERNGTFLLPVERALAVGSTRTELTVQARFGGRFACSVLDEHGGRLAGTVMARSPDGTEHRANMYAGGAPGELSTTDISTFADVLPPGPYELLFDLGARGKHTRYVQIVARETMPIRVRL